MCVGGGGDKGMLVHILHITKEQERKVYNILVILWYCTLNLYVVTVNYGADQVDSFSVSIWCVMFTSKSNIWFYIITLSRHIHVFMVCSNYYVFWCVWVNGIVLGATTKLLLYFIHKLSQRWIWNLNFSGNMQSRPQQNSLKVGCSWQSQLANLAYTVSIMWSIHYIRLYESSIVTK